jgi:hypothetical protein
MGEQQQRYTLRWMKYIIGLYVSVPKHAVGCLGELELREAKNWFLTKWPSLTLKWQTMIPM